MAVSLSSPNINDGDDDDGDDDEDGDDEDGDGYDSDDENQWYSSSMAVSLSSPEYQCLQRQIQIQTWNMK